MSHDHIILTLYSLAQTLVEHPDWSFNIHAVVNNIIEGQPLRNEYIETFNSYCRHPLFNPAPLPVVIRVIRKPS